MGLALHLEPGVHFMNETTLVGIQILYISFQTRKIPIFFWSTLIHTLVSTSRSLEQICGEQTRDAPMRHVLEIESERSCQQYRFYI